jgi:pSer/pThr/pTyr-binding forkhead associated (FHA) protein
MATSNVPSYPVIYVDVNADGSAHLNIAGRHIDYPPAPLGGTRTLITRYAVTIAISLGRPVRMTTSEPAGTFKIAVHPDGTVTELTTAEGKPRRLTRAPTHPPQAPFPGREPTPPEPTSAAQWEAALLGELEPTRMISRQASVIAVLTFDTGATYSIPRSALVGRRPSAPHDEPAEQLVRVNDPTVTLSKNHFRIDQKDGKFWIADLGSGNGTIVQHPASPPVILSPGKRHELRHGDVLLTGDVTITVTIEQAGPAEVSS